MDKLPDQIIGTTRLVNFTIVREDGDDSDWSTAAVVGLVASVGAGGVRTYRATYSSGSGVSYSSSSASGRSGQIEIAASLFTALSPDTTISLEVKVTPPNGKVFADQVFWKLLPRNPTS